MLKNELIKRIEGKLKVPEKRSQNKKLFIFFGIPGSGKSTLARYINTVIPSVYISSDFIALSERLDLTGNYNLTFEILNYLIDKYLGLGYNVVADSNSDKYRIRKELYDIAEKNNACVHCFWVKTDIGTAIKRQEERKRSGDLAKKHLFYVKPEEIVKYYGDIEEPRPGEKVCVIDGKRDIESQLNLDKMLK